MATLAALGVLRAESGETIAVDVLRTSTGVGGYDTTTRPHRLTLRPVSGAWSEPTASTSDGRKGMGFQLFRKLTAAEESASADGKDNASGREAAAGGAGTRARAGSAPVAPSSASSLGGVALGWWSRRRSGDGAALKLSQHSSNQPGFRGPAAAQEPRGGVEMRPSVAAALQERFASVDSLLGTRISSRSPSKSDLEIDALAGLRDLFAIKDRAIVVAFDAANAAAAFAGAAERSAATALAAATQTLVRQLQSFYRLHNPAKVSNGDCEKVARKYATRQSMLWTALREKYNIRTATTRSAGGPLSTSSHNPRKETPLFADHRDDATSAATTTTSAAAIPSCFDWASMGDDDDDDDDGNCSGGGNPSSIGSSDGAEEDDDDAAEREALWRARLKRGASESGLSASSLASSLDTLMGKRGAAAAPSQSGHSLVLGRVARREINTLGATAEMKGKIAPRSRRLGNSKSSLCGHRIHCFFFLFMPLTFASLFN